MKVLHALSPLTYATLLLLHLYLPRFIFIGQVQSFIVSPILQNRNGASTCTLSSLSSSIKTSSYLIDDVSERTNIQELPIFQLLPSIQQSLIHKNNLLLEAAPGAGKTSLVPLALCGKIPNSTISSSLSSSSSGTKNQDENIQSSSIRNIIVVEPRRVATRSAAQRMASLLSQKPGQSIGYIFRGEVQYSQSQTCITVMTDGVLLNKLHEDPELTGIDMVIFDEFHERGIGSDTALALVREIQINFRPDDLKIVVMSATLLGKAKDDLGEIDEKETYDNTGEKLLRVMGGEKHCDIIQSEGRQYPIKYQHSTRSSPLHGLLLNDSNLLIATMADAIEQALRKAPNKGDILAFLPGVKEIRQVVSELNSRRLNGGEKVEIFSLYANLPKSDQDRAIHKDKSSNDDTRRIIVSSPIAEASLTIDGITCVVDSGLRRAPKYDYTTGLPRLVTVPCSKDSVIQRAGRAGRVQKGMCIRLFSEAEMNRFSSNTMPEIASTDLVPTILLLLDWGCSSIDEIHDMPFVDVPSIEAIEKAIDILKDLEAVESYQIANSSTKRFRVTPHGQQIIRMPTHPRFALAISKAQDIAEGSDIDDEKLAAAVITSALMDDDMGQNRDANLATRLMDILEYSKRKSFRERKILQFATSIGPYAKMVVESALDGSLSPLQISNKIGAALLPGFMDVIGQYKGKASYGGSTYMLSLGRSARLDKDERSDSEDHDYIIVVDTSTSDDGKTRVRAYAKVTLQTLKSVAKEVDELYTVGSKGYIVRAKRVVKIGSLELSSKTLPAPSPEEVSQTLLDTIASMGGVYQALVGMQSKKSNAAMKNLCQRVNLARQCLSDEEWPPCFTALNHFMNPSTCDEEIEAEDTMITLIEPWLAAAGSLKAVDLYSTLYSSLTADQLSKLDNQFPINISAPDGSQIPLDYNHDPPMATAKLQQFFGTITSPTIGPQHNPISISLSLLSPSGKDKPLAQTNNLSFFWDEVYPSIRSEMRGRYPKHPWPEDPLNAEPTRLSKKQLLITKPSSSQHEVIDKRKQKRKDKKIQKKNKRKK